MEQFNSSVEEFQSLGAATKKRRAAEVQDSPLNGCSAVLHSTYTGYNLSTIFPYIVSCPNFLINFVQAPPKDMQTSEIFVFYNPQRHMTSTNVDTNQCNRKPANSS